MKRHGEMRDISAADDAMFAHCEMETNIASRGCRSGGLNSMSGTTLEDTQTGFVLNNKSAMVAVCQTQTQQNSELKYLELLLSY